MTLSWQKVKGATSYIVYEKVGKTIQKIGETDKLYAKSDHRRVPEKRLFLLALLGGAAGGLLGMYAFRHKTRHRNFIFGFWTLALLQLGALAYLAYRFL